MLASLRLCSSVPASGRCKTALGGVQSIFDLTAPTGRLGPPAPSGDRRRRTLAPPHSTAAEGCALRLHPRKKDALPAFDDNAFAMALLEEKHVLIVPARR